VRVGRTEADGYGTAAQGIQLASSDGTELTVPAGALSQADSLSVSTPDSFSGSGIPANATPTSVAREVLLGKSDTVLRKPATLRVPYRDADIAGLDPTRLRLYRWDVSAGLWRVVNTSKVDLAGKKVSAELYGFSLYRIMAYAPGSESLINSREVYSTPNPAKGDTLYFKVPLINDSDVTIQVFNVAGEEVKELSSSGLGGTVLHIPWSVQDVASGVYIYQVEAKSGSRTDKVRKKLAIIH
jgi:hypothetical protein